MAPVVSEVLRSLHASSKTQYLALRRQPMNVASAHCEEWRDSRFALDTRDKETYFAPVPTYHGAHLAHPPAFSLSVPTQRRLDNTIEGASRTHISTHEYIDPIPSPIAPVIVSVIHPSRLLPDLIVRGVAALHK